MTEPPDFTFQTVAIDHLERLYGVGRDTNRLAHDLNNQFTTIRGFSEMLEGSLPPNHPLSDLAKQVTHGCARALETLRALPVGAIPPTSKADSSALIATLLELVAECPAQQVLFDTSFPSTDIAIRASEEESHALLDEILRLVCDNTTPGGKITITVHHNDGKAVVQFLLSSPISAWNSNTQGRLALLLLTAGLDRLGGGLTTSAVPGGEAALKITLPACYRQSLDPPAPLPAKSPAQPPSILVVDDEPSFRSFVRDYLAENGYRAFEAEDGNDAIRQLDQRGHDLVVLDIFMAEPDGFETLRRIRAAYPSLPVVVMSGAAVDYLHTATLLGASEAVSKAELPDRLAGMVRNLTAKQVMSA